MLRLFRVAFIAGFIAISVMYQRHPENPLDDPLFTRFPLAGSYQSSVGQIKVPFHGYDGDALIIACKANATAVQAVLDEGFFALRTDKDEAIALVWVMDYKGMQLKITKIMYEIPVLVPTVKLYSLSSLQWTSQKLNWKQRMHLQRLLICTIRPLPSSTCTSCG